MKNKGASFFLIAAPFLLFFFLDRIVPNKESFSGQIPLLIFLLFAIVTLLISLLFSFLKKRLNQEEMTIFQIISLIALTYFSYRNILPGAGSQMAFVVSLGLSMLYIIALSDLTNSVQRLFLGLKPRFEVPLGVRLYDTVMLIVTYFLIFLVFFAATSFGVLNYFVVVFGILMGAVLVMGSKELNRGINVTAREEPELFKMLERVTKEFDIAMPHAVVLTPDSSIAVTGIFRKTLIIGVASLRHLRENELEAIIAHEMGHFYGRDTVFGSLIYSFIKSMDYAGKFIRAFSRLHIIVFAIGMGVLLFTWLFSIVAQLYTRQREYFADIYAAQVVGPKTFAGALERYAGYTRLFTDVSVPIIIGLYRKTHGYPKNIYEFIASRTKEKMYAHYLLAEKSKRSLFGTHPPLAKRLAAVLKMHYPESKSERPLVSILRTLKKDEEKFSVPYAVYVLRQTGIMTYSEFQEILEKSGKGK